MSKSDLVGATEATAIIGCSRQQTHKILNSGRLRGQKVSGEFWVVERSEVKRYKKAFDKRKNGVAA